MTGGGIDGLMLGIDLGAGSLKATLVRPDGTTAGEASATITTSNPRFGWAEQDPREWWTAFCTAVPAALADAGATGEAVAVVGFSGGAHIGVLCGAGGQVLRPAILWSDSRAAAEAAELRERADARILELTLNRANPTWLLPQLMWINRHDPVSAAYASRIVFLVDGKIVDELHDPDAEQVLDKMKSFGET